MDKINYDLIIRDAHSHTPLDRRTIKNKEDFLSALEKYRFIFGLSFKELMRVYDCDIDEVEKYVRERERKREGRNSIERLKG